MARNKVSADIQELAVQEPPCSVPAAESADAADQIFNVATAGDTEPAVSVEDSLPDEQLKPEDLGGSSASSPSTGPTTYAKGGGTDVYGNATRPRKGSTRPADIESQVWSMMGPSKRAREIAKRVKLASEGKAASAQTTAAYTPAGSDVDSNCCAGAAVPCASTSDISTTASHTDIQYMAEIDELVSDAMLFHD